MEPITRLLFEQPYMQAIIGASAMLVALAGWHWARQEGTDTRRWRYGMLIIAMLTAAGEVTQWAVVTDREHITAQLDRAAVALQKPDVAAILSLTDETLVADGRTQEQFARWLEGALHDTKIRNARVERLEIQFPSHDEAAARVTGIATIESPSYGGIITGTWKIEFSRVGGKWKIVSIDPTDGVRPFP